MDRPDDPHEPRRLRIQPTELGRETFLPHAPLRERTLVPAYAKIVPVSGLGGHIQVLEMRDPGPTYSAEFVAVRSGQVVLFVNDVMPLWFGYLLPNRSAELRDLYLNNRGEAGVTIKQIPRDPR